MVYCFLVGKRIIIVSFGSNDGDGAKDIKKAEESLALLSPYPVSYAYTSHQIICEDSTHKSLEETIKAEKDCEILIMPLLIQRGSQYEKLLALNKSCALPLLGSKGNAERVAEIINENLERREGLRYLIIAHGSEEVSTSEYKVLESLLRDDISIATLKGDLSYKDAHIEEKSVHIFPFLLTYAHHAKNEIAGDVVSHFEEQGKDVSLSECGLLSSFPSLIKIFEKNLMSLLEEDVLPS